MPPLNFNVIVPLIVLSAWACALLLVDLFLKNKGITALLAALGLALALGLTLSQIGYSAASFNTVGVADVVVDGFSTFINALLLTSGLLSVAVAYDYLKRTGIERGEYYSLRLFSIAGMMLMAQASNLIIVLLALELLSIPLYVLAAFARPRIESEEAGLKYFLLGMGMVNMVSIARFILLLLSRIAALGVDVHGVSHHLPTGGCCHLASDLAPVSSPAAS